MAMSYGYVYVAQVAMGANMNQLLKAFTEAESYDGPSLIIAYAPCINQGINMAKSISQEKRAVESGYWHLYRYNPAFAEKGENPFILDSKDPTMDYEEFIMSETRYTSLKRPCPKPPTSSSRAKAEAQRLATYAPAEKNNRYVKGCRSDAYHLAAFLWAK